MSSFRELFGAEPEVSAHAPRRANLIGEHTDYSEGFVLPVTIPQRTRVELRRRRDDMVRVLGPAEEDRGVPRRRRGAPARMAGLRTGADRSFAPSAARRVRGAHRLGRAAGGAGCRRARRSRSRCFGLTARREVSVPDLDRLVALAFGGAIVVAGRTEGLRTSMERVAERYRAQTGRTATVLVPGRSQRERVSRNESLTPRGRPARSAASAISVRSKQP